MRILAGEAKGKTLKTREGKGTRPTDSRSREMLFNIFGARVVGAEFLDLYAGTGAVGLEALSRGADFCIFVEQNAVACRVIKENLRALGFSDRAQVWNATVKTAVKRLIDNQKYFDIVFADPPFSNPHELKDLSVRLSEAAALLQRAKTAQTADFGMDKSRQLLHNVAGQNTALLSQPTASSVLVIQHHRKAQPILGTDFELQQERRAGESTLSFFQLVEEATKPAASEEISEASIEVL
ncbi:MAG: rRNA (guanine966-N2)-methyltransferase [Abditibacteriota bacterium]|nr:rRNA (guanine966-N2)-methyltransferase [Abditibacteriota bacterium]